MDKVYIVCYEEQDYGNPLFSVLFATNDKEKAEKYSAQMREEYGLIEDDDFFSIYIREYENGHLIEED